MIVVDASVAVKWLLFEVGSDAATRLLRDHGSEIVGPDLLLVEVAGAVIRRANMGLIEPDDAFALLDAWAGADKADVPPQFETTSPRLLMAARIALRLRHPVKDCVYLGLAVELDCDLITCDAKFQAKAATVYSHVKLLADDAL